MISLKLSEELVMITQTQVMRKKALLHTYALTQTACSVMLMVLANSAKISTESVTASANSAPLTA